MARSGLEWTALILVVIGAINWGLVGAVNWNLVDAIFGFMPMLGRIIYILVGLSGLYMLWAAFKG